jgi:hypothetical protein
MKAILGFLLGYFVAGPILIGLGALAFFYWLFFM